MRRILSFTPFDLIDFFLDFKRFEVVELGLVGLKLRVELVFTSLFLRFIANGDCQVDSDVIDRHQREREEDIVSYSSE